MNLKPIIPFEPIGTDVIPQGDEWIAQIKWDGVRILTYKDGDIVRLFNRRKNERSLNYPELIDIKRFCKASSVILDGEIIALNEGKPSFNKVMKRDGIRLKERVKKVKNQVPITYMIFDIVYLDGNWVISKPFIERQNILKEIIIPQDDIQIVENFYSKEELFNIIKANDMEGIVCKKIHSPYLINQKRDIWQKVKNYKDLYALIGGATFRGNTVNALLVGLYDSKDRFWYIGHVGTGHLTRDDWKALTQVVKKLSVSKMPFINKPERSKEALWVKPLIAVKVKYIQWPKGHYLRQPSIKAFVDVPPYNCTFEKQNLINQL